MASLDGGTRYEAWRFSGERDALWKKVLCAKYGLYGICLTLHLGVDRYNDCSYVWQDIMKTSYEDFVLEILSVYGWILG